MCLVECLLLLFCCVFPRFVGNIFGGGYLCRKRWDMLAIISHLPVDDAQCFCGCLTQEPMFLCHCFEGLTKAFVGISSPQLPLWAGFSFMSLPTTKEDSILLNVPTQQRNITIDPKASSQTDQMQRYLNSDHQGQKATQRMVRQDPIWNRTLRY